VLLHGAEDQQDDEINTAGELQKKRTVQARDQEDLSAVEKALIIAQDIKEKKEYGGYEEENHGPTRKTGHPFEKTI
jgi:hypothetical protein